MKRYLILLFALWSLVVGAGEPEHRTAGIREHAGAGEPVSLVAVRSGRHRDFDRVVFEFRGRLPGYRLEYVDRPVRACGSGEPLSLPGDGWLLVSLTPARAHTETGEALVSETRRAVDYPVLRTLARTCDFEGTVGWVLALAEPNRYRVLTLDNPPRLVVDVRH
jgi:hypothetical protein